MSQGQRNQCAWSEILILQACIIQQRKMQNTKQTHQQHSYHYIVLNIVLQRVTDIRRETQLAAAVSGIFHPFLGEFGTLRALLHVHS